MIEFLFAERIESGKTDFDKVPTKLKQAVADVLIKNKNHPEFVPINYGGTK